MDVDFVANAEGLINMLDNKWPAYCSYFASAMTLMLRQQGIPARIVGGFMASEPVGKNRDRLLARVRDAHAWVEVLLPVVDANNKEIGKRWITFDPTPGNRIDVVRKTNCLNEIADASYLFQLRFRAKLEEINFRQFLKQLLMVLLILYFLSNLKKLIDFLKNKDFLRKSHDGTTKRAAHPCLAIYQQFEMALRKNFGMTRGDAETDTELLERLKTSSQVLSKKACPHRTFSYSLPSCAFRLRSRKGM